MANVLKLLIFFYIAFLLSACVNFSGAARPSTWSEKIFTSLTCEAPISEIKKLAGKRFLSSNSSKANYVIRHNATDISLIFKNGKLTNAKLGWMYSYGKMTWAEIPNLSCNKQ